MRHTRFRDAITAHRALLWVGGLLLVALAMPGPSALAAQMVKKDPTPTPPTGAAPTFTIAAPLFGPTKIPEGPVGTYVQVTANAGSGWTPNATITLSVEANASCDPSGAIPVSTKQAITVGGDSSFSAVFQWPVSAGQAPNYVVCATESGAGTQVGKTSNLFTVLSPNTPSINVSPLSVPQGGTVQVNGTNFYPVTTIRLWLQHPGQDFLQDPGDPIPTTNLQPSGEGSFSVSVKLPTDRTTSNVIVATIGDNFYPEPNPGVYPISAASQPLTILAATATPQVTPTPIVTPNPGNTASNSSGNSGTSGLLVALLGLIAVVLLVAGVVVAVLALRGRNNPPDGDASDRRPSGGFGGGYMGDGPLDQTIADADWQGRNWDEDDRWASPPGRPWSGGRASSPYGPPQSGRNPMDDEDDDRYRTRMGDPYQSSPPPPPTSRPNYPPQSRPMGPPQSRPMPPRSNPRPPNPGWGDNGGNDQGMDTGPAPWPPRQ